MKDTATIEIPLHILDTLQITPEQIKFELAKYLYKEYNLPLEQVEEIAGLRGIRSNKLLEQLFIQDTWLTQEWDVEPGTELNNLIQSYKQLASTKKVAKRVQAILQTFASILLALKAPTNNIEGTSEMLLEDIFGPLPSEQEKELYSIHRSARYLRRVIYTAQSMVQIEQGTFELNVQEIKAKDVIEEAISCVLDMSADTKTRLEYNLPDELPNIWADSLKMFHALFCVMLNIRATEINIIVKYNKERIEVNIIDNGEGYSADYIEHFTRFGGWPSIEASEISRFEIVLSKYIITKHGGDMEIRHQKGVGSETIIKLPVYQNVFESK